MDNLSITPWDTAAIIYSDHGMQHYYRCLPEGRTRPLNMQRHRIEKVWPYHHAGGQAPLPNAVACIRATGKETSFLTDPDKELGPRGPQ